jgi:CHAT domain-containing protein/tetratricopeptide (TPR) repeat protein
MDSGHLDVEELLGWLPMPEPPAVLRAASRRTETLTAQWWSGGDSGALPALVQAWEGLLADPAFAAAPLEYRLMCHERAALAYCWRAVVRSAAADLDRAAAQLAVVIRHDPPWTDDLLYHRGIYHYSAATVRRDPEDHARAIAILRDLVARLPPSDTRLRPRCIDVLGRTLLDRDTDNASARTGTINEVIDLLSEALAGIPPNAPYRGMVAQHLATALGSRFKSTGRLADLDAAIAALEQNPLVQTYGEAETMRASNLGIYYGRRYRKLFDPDDMRRSLEWHERAVAIAPKDSPAFPVALTNYGNALLWAYEHTGDQSLVERAMRAQEQVVKITDPGHRLYPSRLNNLGNTMSTWFDLTRDPSHLDLAIELYERAIALTPSDDSDLASRHYNAANTRYLRYQVRGRRRDRLAAVRHYRRACETGMDREPEWVLGAARKWGQLVAERNEWRAATEPYQIAVAAVEHLFASQLSRKHKEAWLRTADGLPAEAGYVFHRAGRPADAVLIQERGRALLMAEALRRDGGASVERPLDIDDVFAAAGSRPLVYLDAGAPGGVALIADPRRRAVRAVDLPGLRDRGVSDRAELLRAAYHSRYREPARWLGAVDAVTRWTYDEVMGPLLAALPGVDAVTLVPVGRLTMLPLHAAWEPSTGDEEGRRYALDQVTVSYIATARALAAAGAGMTAALHGALVIDEPAPVSAPRLPLSHVEAAAVRLATDPVRVLPGESATRAAVLADLGRYDLIHMSCHGFGRPDSPLDSGVLLARDELLRLADLYDLPAAGWARPRLVVLSACETDQPGTELPDEVVSLPSGLIQAGCRGVVAAQWEVSSLASALLSVWFYRTWRPGIPPGAALAEAQRWLRRLTNAELARCARPDGAGSALGLPASAGRPLWMAARRRPAQERRFAHPAYWGAFAHVGV